MAKQMLMSLKEISRTYQLEGVSHRVLKGVSLQVTEGELLAVVGASGSGKSTLMNIMGLLDKPDTGEYLLEQRNVDGLTEDETASLRNQNIGFVFQQFNLLPRLTARQNIALPLIYRHVPSEEINERIDAVLERVGMLSYAHYRPTQLSGGQQQRVAIARALVGEPKVILADEPTGALDSQTRSEVMGLFKTLHEEGRTLILVTHDEHIASQCTRQITLADGEIIAESM